MENQKIVVMPKKSITLILAIAAFFSCAIMVFAVFKFEYGGSGLMSTTAGIYAAKIFFLLCAVLFLYASVFHLKRFINPKPLIIADESGFTDSSNTNSMGFVPWKDVKNIYIATMQRNRMIQVELIYPDVYLDRLSGAARKAAEFNMKMGYQPISFVMNGTDKNTDEFFADIMTLWEQNRNR